MSLDLSLDMGFVRSWFESDSDPAENSAESSSGRKVNWGAISGMALSVAFSLVCWAGVIWIVERVFDDPLRLGQSPTFHFNLNSAEDGPGRERGDR